MKFWNNNTFQFTLTFKWYSHFRFCCCCWNIVAESLYLDFNSVVTLSKVHSTHFFSVIMRMIFRTRVFIIILDHVNDFNQWDATYALWNEKLFVLFYHCFETIVEH